ncbi:MAG: aminotransferase class I/II-fold pyridoxal phosphate-dependent enzyme [Spirochaetaceae bacterium]|nr:MAG: aminotransferase class I/II-fold pyridoxal phosphate-dependent enzyme [Spirochaetaceae bacterium]
MAVETTNRMKRRGKPAFPRFRARRLVAQLWGTTTLGDCLIALWNIFNPRYRVQGPTIGAFERAFARHVGVRYAHSFSSGRVALYALLRAMGVGPGDEVLLQVPTHIVVANAIRYVGARPVYVDCMLDTYNMDLDLAERRITPNTKVLLLQHTFGIPVDMDAAMELVRRHGLILIEDCVHALGTTFKGRQIGSFGHAAFFSTEETKIISSTMGGMAVTNDPKLSQELLRFQSSCPWPSDSLTARYLLKLIVYHLFAHPYLHPYTRPVYMFLRRSPKTHLAPGATAGNEQRGVRPRLYEQRLSNAQAVLALRQLRRLEANLSHRRAVAEAYRTLLSEIGIPVPAPPAGSAPAFVRYPIWVQDRRKAMRIASSHVVLGQWFNTVLEESITPEHGDYERGSCPRAEQAAEHLVNLPTHPRVKRHDVDSIVSAVARADVLAGRTA